MRIPAIATLFAAALLVPGPVAAAPALKFQSSDDYAKLCGIAQPGNDCRQGFMDANNWVRFNSDAKMCEPDLKTSLGSPEYTASVNEEIGNAIGWLKQNPKAAGLDYVQSLGRALIALYTCK